jgi:hypothetical protein
VLEKEVQAVASILVVERRPTGEKFGFPNPCPTKVEKTPPASGPFLLIDVKGLGLANETIKLE